MTLLVKFKSLPFIHDFKQFIGYYSFYTEKKCKKSSDIVEFKQNFIKNLKIILIFAVEDHGLERFKLLLLGLVVTAPYKEKKCK